MERHLYRFTQEYNFLTHGHQDDVSNMCLSFTTRFPVIDSQGSEWGMVTLPLVFFLRPINIVLINNSSVLLEPGYQSRGVWYCPPPLN